MKDAPSGHTSPTYVQRQEQLDEACNQLAAARVLAVDTEFHRENTYYPQFALLQIASGEHCFIIDPLAIADLSPLWQLLAEEHILKVLHAGRQDIEIILLQSGRVPLPLFDTQIAAALTGLGEQIGLASLVQRLLKKRLPKLESFSDWLARPLSPEQIAYGADDVIFLLPVYQQLKDRLKAQGRLTWLEQEQRRLTDPASYRNEPASAFWRVKGSNRLKPRQLAVLRALAAWREVRAEAADKPRRRIVSDEVLVAMARRSHITLDDLGRMRGIGVATLRKYGRDLLAAWQQGSDCPEGDWPQVEVNNHSPGTELRQEMLATLVKLRADEIQIAPSMLAKRAELARLASWAQRGHGKPPDVDCLKGWRRQLVGNDLLRLLEGELCLRVDASSRRPTTEPLS